MNKLTSAKTEAAKAAALLGSLAAVAGCAGGTQEAEKPNIVLILADDMGYGDVSALNGNSRILTENIDKIAREGVIFTDAHTSSSVSTPSRYSLLTGQYNWRSSLKDGVLWGYSEALIPRERQTIAGMLREQGYSTAALGKWHLGWHWANVEKGVDSVDFSLPITDGPVSRGFDYFYGIAASLDMPPYVYVENDTPTALPDRITANKEPFSWWREGPTGADFKHEEVLPNLTERAVEYIHEHSKGGKPFFLYLPLPAPHTPILPADEYKGKSGLNPYGDFVLMVDAMVGKVMDALEDSKIAENTILIFTTDNGCSPEADFAALEAAGHYPSYIYRGHKADLFDGGHRVPCVVRWPSRIKPHVIEQTVCLTDFYATFAELTGYELSNDEAEDSYSILPLLTGEDTAEPIREATVHHSIYGDFTIRQGKWKLLLSPSSGGWSYPAPGTDDEAIAALPEVQLYDMEADPGETVNLYAEYTEIVEKLKSLLNQYIENGYSRP